MANMEAAEDQPPSTRANAVERQKRSTGRSLSSHAAGSSDRSWTQSRYDRSTSMSDLPGGPASTSNNIADASPHPPTADDGTQANMSTPLNVQKMTRSKTLWPDSSN